MSQIDQDPGRRNVRASRSDRIRADQVIRENMGRDSEGRPGGQFLGHMRDIRYRRAEVTSGVGMDFHLIGDAAKSAVLVFKRASFNMARLLGFSQ